MIWPARFPPLQCWLHAMAIILLALISCSASARCEVNVRGTAAEVRIDARQALLSDVLGALGTNFKVRYNSLIALDEVIISGTYSGPLVEVLARILTDLNYVVKTKEGTVEIIIVGRPGVAPAAVATTQPTLPTNTDPAAQWRSPTVRKP